MGGNSGDPLVRLLAAMPEPGDTGNVLLRSGMGVELDPNTLRASQFRIRPDTRGTRQTYTTVSLCAAIRCLHIKRLHRGRCMQLWGKIAARAGTTGVLQASNPKSSASLWTPLSRRTRVTTVCPTPLHSPSRPNHGCTRSQRATRSNTYQSQRARRRRAPLVRTAPSRRRDTCTMFCGTIACDCRSRRLEARSHRQAGLPCPATDRTGRRQQLESASVCIQDPAALKQMAHRRHFPSGAIIESRFAREPLFVGDRNPLTRSVPGYVQSPERDPRMPTNLRPHCGTQATRRLTET
jgi:hypothetical protein